MENGQPGLFGKAATSLDIAYSLFDNVPQRVSRLARESFAATRSVLPAAFNFGSVCVQCCHLFISSLFSDFSRRLQKRARQVKKSRSTIDRSSQASLMQEGG